MTSTPAIILTHLSHRYGSTVALDDVSLTIERGATVGLIGPDGVGKSTLLSLIAGVRVIQEGQVQVLGGDMKQARVRQALSHQIAYMPQGLGKNLYPTLSVYENIEFHARLFGLNREERDARMERLLSATGLSPFLERAAGKLSGGMKQKLSLCCALVHNPDLLVLDEPTTGVDPLSRRQFWSLVHDLRAEMGDMTVLVATAYIDEAEQFEQLLAMDAGKLLTHSSTQSLMTDLGVQTLEEAYIQLLPEEKKRGVGNFVITPFESLPNTPPVMEARGLTKRFGDFVAVDHVNFTIQKGEIFGFLGSNGCGKSTTMKMLTGLLDATSGTATLLGEPIDAGSLNTKKRVGYMSQAFSLYEELTVRQNLDLHAKLYQIPQPDQTITQSLHDFDLAHVAHVKPASLPLGIRQRLQLAAACLHQPEVLILDEPTSGVDPAARDMFWHKLVQLSRQQRITIFISTHFMNEVERCDRVSLMHQGRVLTVGTPAELLSQSGQNTTEEAFIYYLQQNGEHDTSAPAILSTSPIQQSTTHRRPSWFNAIYTFARRESKELWRDKIRLFFAALGPAILLASLGWAISFDITHIAFTVHDRDQSQASRQLIESFSHSPYFTETPLSLSEQQADQRLRSHQVSVVMDIPESFGRDILTKHQTTVNFQIDGTAPFNAINIAAYTQGIMQQHNQTLLAQQSISLPPNAQLIPRFLYNQDFKSVNAMVPSIIMLVLMMIPTVMSALAVVRERELGSIQNLYASPASVPQYLLGKQLPYIMMGALNFILLAVMAVFWFDIAMKGSFWATLLGAILLVCASTALGLLISSFTRSQTAAFFVSALGSMVPTVNFSGLMYPIATQTGGAYAIGIGFPASWFGTISKGGFTKGLGWADFGREYIMLLLFFIVYLVLACVFLKKQER